MWIYKDKKIEKIEDFGDLPPYGFIYRITNIETGKFYIGKKQLISVTNKKLGKKELIVIKEERKLNKVQGKQPSKKQVIQESNWLDYWGSCKPLLEEIKQLGKEKYKREIIQITSNTKQLTYYETLYQMSENVLQRDDCHNENIAGKWYKKDFN
jgi:predicted SPOUT superfamily RNA methylase MTH1